MHDHILFMYHQSWAPNKCSKNEFAASMNQFQPVPDKGIHLSHLLHLIACYTSKQRRLKMNFYLSSYPTILAWGFPLSKICMSICTWIISWLRKYMTQQLPKQLPRIFKTGSDGCWRWPLCDSRRALDTWRKHNKRPPVEDWWNKLCNIHAMK